MWRELLSKVNPERLVLAVTVCGLWWEETVYGPFAVFESTDKTLAFHARNWTNLKEITFINCHLSACLAFGTGLFLLPSPSFLSPSPPTPAWPRPLSLTWRTHLWNSFVRPDPNDAYSTQSLAGIAAATRAFLRIILSSGTLPGPSDDQPVTCSVHFALLEPAADNLLFETSALRDNLAQRQLAEVRRVVETLASEGSGRLEVHVERLSDCRHDLMEEAMMPDERWEESSDLSSASSGDYTREEALMGWTWDDFMEGQDEPEEDLEADPDYEPPSDSDSESSEAALEA